MKADDWTPMAYDWNDDLMTNSEGFKSGGIHQRNAGIYPGNAPTYDPEFVESIGFKFSIAAFYADYTDIQLEMAPEGSPQLDNAGEGEIKGFELESRWSPLDTLFLEVTLGHLDAVITKSDPDAVNTGFPSCRRCRAGHWQPRSSRSSVSAICTIIARLDYNSPDQGVF